MKKIMSRHELINTNIQKQMVNEEFYRINALNYTGFCDDGTSYSEVIAQWLYEDFYKEEELKKLLLSNSNMKSETTFPAEPIHNKAEITYNPKSNRNEENIAKRLFQMDNLKIVDSPFLKLVDYQVPINRVQHSSEGKADLVFSDDKFIMIGELKDEDSSETLLRAVVEAKTYQYKIESCDTSLKRYADCYLKKQSQSTPHLIQPAVLLFENSESQPWKDFLFCTNNNHSWLKQLIIHWNMQIFAVKLIKDGSSYAERNYCIERIGKEWAKQ